MQFYFAFLLFSLFITHNAIEDNIFRLQKGNTFANTPSPYDVVPKSISYYVEDNEFKDLPLLILHQIAFYTCIDFQNKMSKIENKNGINFLTTSKENKIKFPNKKNKPTNVYLKINIFNDTRQLSYYIGRALGLIPEITRSDRGNNVKIFKNNILSSYKSQYKKKRKLPNFYKNTQFDFASIMLFDPKYGSKNKKLTYKTKLYPYYDKLIPTTRSFSFNDMKHINNKHCNNYCKNPLKCENGGFPTFECDKCFCPYGFIGRKCENTLPSFGNCAQKTYLASRSKKKVTLKITNDICHYLIQSNKRKKVKIEILKLKINSDTLCDKGYNIQIKYRKDKGAAGLILCGNYTNIKLPSESSKVHIFVRGTKIKNELKISYQEVSK